MNIKLPQFLTASLVILLLNACAHKQPLPTPPDQANIPSPPVSSPLPDDSDITSTIDPPIEESTPDVPAMSQPFPLAGTFPKPPELGTQIAFWRNVYGVWRRSQVVLHDNRHLNLVYEIVNLPGEVSESYTLMQEQVLKERRRLWEDRLRRLERKLSAGLSLDTDEKSLATLIVASCHSRTAVNGASERLRLQRGLRERFKRGLEISGRYDRNIRAIFRQARLPEDLAYLPHVESSFQVDAKSSAGAVGVWQFTRSAASTFMNVDAALDERLDPIASARGAARYLGHAYNKLGSWPLALTSYNHGIGGMQRAKNIFGHDFVRIVRQYDHPQFGFASRNFYAEFLAAREVASQSARFFPEGVHFDPPINWDRIVLKQNAPVSALAQHYRTEKWRLTTMNPAWSDNAKADKVPLPAGTEVWLPPGTLRRMAQQ